MEITKDAFIKRKDQHLLSSQVADDLVMLDTETGDYFGLDPIGSFIWEKLQQPTSMTKIFAAAEQQYDVEEDQFYADVMPFIVMLEEKGLLEVVSA